MYCPIPGFVAFCVLRRLLIPNDIFAMEDAMSSPACSDLVLVIFMLHIAQNIN